MMALVHTIALSDVKSAERLDAEFFRPDFMRFEAATHEHNATTLGTVAATIKRGVQPQYDEDGSIPVLRTVNIRELEFSSARQEFINGVFASENPRGIVKPGDILVTSTGIGTLGRVAFQHEQATYFADGHITYIRGITGFDPLYVCTFLQSRIGRALIERRQRGSSGQMEVYPTDLASIPIPKLSKSLQSKAVRLCREAWSKVQIGRDAYAEAEASLESALGLNRLDLTRRLFYERSFPDVRAAGRFDPDYFSPRTQSLIAALSRDGLTIANVADPTKRRFKAKAGVQFQYIEISDVTANGTADSSPVAGEDAPSRATWIVRPGDIITSTVRPIRRLSAMIADDQSGSVCSSGFAVLRPKNADDVAPELLLVYLRLPLVCELLDLHTTASMYPAISTPDLMQIPIAVPSEATRRKIVGKVRESIDARSGARRLLDKAKAVIERAILGER